MKPQLVLGGCAFAVLAGACNPNLLPSTDATRDAGNTGTSASAAPNLPAPSNAGGSDASVENVVKDAGVSTSSSASADTTETQGASASYSASETSSQVPDVAPSEIVTASAASSDVPDVVPSQTVTASGASSDVPDVVPSQIVTASAASSDVPDVVPSQTVTASGASSDVPDVVPSQIVTASAANSDVPDVVPSQTVTASATSTDVPDVVPSQIVTASATSTDVPGVDTSSPSDSIPIGVPTDFPVNPDVDAGDDAGTDDSGEVASSASSATDIPSATDAPSATDIPSATDAPSASASATEVPSASATVSATSTAPSLDPEQLFNEEQFGGNGRTCLTCHGAVTGTISPAEVQALYSADPNAPLFNPIDSDDGVGTNYSRLLNHATVRVGIPLPAGVTLTGNPSVTSVVFNRSIPSTLNTPALDSVLMWDGRAPDLMAQALDAIEGHAQATINPTSVQLDLIAEFEQSEAFFSSDALRQYDQGGPAPTLPAGNTASEQSGRRFFVNSAFGICGQCHGGPMLNQTTAFSGLGVGTRFQTVSVSEFNSQGNPVYQFTFPDPRRPGRTVTTRTPDPGRALISGKFSDVNFFKIPTLWGITKTAPYFHDNSADTLEALMEHYQKFLATFRPISDQDKADILAYLKLL